MEDLPALVLERVASYLGDADVLSLGATCTRAREACEEEAVWRPRCEAYGIRCAVPASSGSVQRQGEWPEVEKPPAHDDPSTCPAAQQPMQQPMEADTEPDSGSEPEQPLEITRVAAGSADITPGLSCRNLYLGLLRHYGVLLTGQQPMKDLGPAAQDTASLSTLGPALWQATAMPFGGMIVAQFEAPAQIVLYSVVAYRLNGPVRGRPVLRIAARTPPPRVRRTSPTSPSKAAPDASPAAAEGSTAAGSVGTEATGTPAPAPPLAAAEQAASASGSGQQAPQTEVSGAAGAASPPRPAHLWKRLVGMLQGMLSAGGGGGGGGDGSGQESSSPAAAASPSSGQPSGSGEPGNPHPPAAQHASQHPPWPSHVTCCCQVHPGPDGMPEEHPALLRFLAVAAPSLAGPSADASASNSASNGASNGAESSPSSSGGTGGSGGGIGSSAAGARLNGGGGGFIFHCAHFCRHTDFDPLLRHTGSLGPGVPMNLIDLPMRPHLPVAHVTTASTTTVTAAAAPTQVASSSSGGTGADPSATLPAADPSSQGPSTVQPGLVPPSVSAASASALDPHQPQPQPQPLVLSRVPELDMQYARLCSVQYIQHHTRFLRRRSGDSQESKALVYRPLMRGQGHPLAGLWRGTYGFHGMEILNFALEAPPGLHPADMSSPNVGEGGISSPMLLRGVKITGDSNVPRGQVSIEMDVSAPHPRPTTPPGQRFALPSNLHTGVQEEGPDGLASCVVQAVYRGRGHIAQTGFERDSWTTVEVVVFSDACMGVAWHELESFSMFSRLPL